MRVPKFSVCIVLLLAATPVFADTNNPPPLRVGVISPISGDFARYGMGVVKAMQMANAMLPGRQLSLAIEDNRSCQSPEAVSAFHKLVTIDRAEIVVTFCTAAAQAVLPVAKAKGLPVIQLTEPGPDPSGYLVKLMPDSVAFVDYLARDLRRKYDKIALVANTTEVNTGVRGNLPLFTKAFEKLGGKIVLTIDFPDSETDFRTILLRIRSSGADAVVPFIWPVRQMADFLTQADQLDLWSSVKLGGSFVFEFAYPQLVEVYPRLATLNGLESVNFLNETNPAFVAEYQKRYGEQPPQFADYAHDAAAAIKRCGTNQDCLRSKSRGVSGDIEFDRNGRRMGKFVSKRLFDGKFEPVPSEELVSTGLS